MCWSTVRKGQVVIGEHRVVTTARPHRKDLKLLTYVLSYKLIVNPLRLPCFAEFVLLGLLSRVCKLNIKFYEMDEGKYLKDQKNLWGTLPVGK